MTALTEPPCPRCLALARKSGSFRTEAIQRLPSRAPPLDMDGKPCCHDCQAADTLLRIAAVPGFEAARIATANDRQEQYRLPGPKTTGLVLAGIMRPSKKGDLEKQHRWLHKNNWFGLEDGWDL